MNSQVDEFVGKGLYPEKIAIQGEAGHADRPSETSGLGRECGFADFLEIEALDIKCAILEDVYGVIEQVITGQAG